MYLNKHNQVCSDEEALELLKISVELSSKTDDEIERIVSILKKISEGFVAASWVMMSDPNDTERHDKGPIPSCS